MLWLFTKIWQHRNNLILAIQVMAALRKTAQEICREYIRQQIKNRLKERLVIMAVEVTLLAIAIILSQEIHSLASRLFSTLILWGITLYNVLEFCFFTIPELTRLQRMLKSKAGYAVKYLLEISLVNEAMQLNLVFLAVCLFIGTASRTYMGSHLSYTQPIKELLTNRFNF